MITAYETYGFQRGEDLVSSHLPLVKRIATHFVGEASFAH